MNSILPTLSATRIQELDLDPIRFKLVESDGYSHACADVLIEQYRRFLTLTAKHPEQSIVPSTAVDAVWHHHILDTAKYRADCMYAFGRIVDHFPYFGIRDADDAARLQAAYANTQRLLTEEFGEDFTLPAEIANELSASICDAPAAAICDAQASICDAATGASICDAQASTCDGSVVSRSAERPSLAALST